MRTRSAPTVLARKVSPTKWEQDSPTTTESTEEGDSPQTASTPESVWANKYKLTRAHSMGARPHSEACKTNPEYHLGPSPIIDVGDIKMEELHRGVMIRKGRKCDITLSLYTLAWDRCRVNNKRKQPGGIVKRCELSLHDVLGARSHLNYSLKRVFQKRSDLFKMRVYTYKTTPTGQWKNCYYQFYCGSLRSAQEWSKNINTRLNLLCRPRRCHVYINPFSGEGDACNIYNTQIAHIFQIAGITTTVTVTEGAGHAHDSVTKLDINETDAIVCIGGDGLFNEVFSSILWKQQIEKFGDEAGSRDPEQCPVKIGLIPAGSTNVVVFCTTGNVDPTTSALQIALGREVKIDLISVWSKGRIKRFGTNFVGYGFLGDVLKESEYYRWMGPTRYDFSGIKTIMSLGSYSGQLMFKEGLTSGTPNDRNRCKKGCHVCKELLVQPDRRWSVIDGVFASIDGCIMSCCSPQAHEGLSPAAHLGDGCLDLIVHRSASGLRYLRYLANTALFSKPFTGDLVNVYRVTEFKFKANCVPAHVSAGCSNCSNWNIDGELYEEHEIHVKVHRQMITLLASQQEPCPTL